MSIKKGKRMEGGNKYKMKNKKAEEVIKRIQEVNQTFTIKVLGDAENKVNAFTITSECQQFSSFRKNEYRGIQKNTIKLLEEAEIKFKILK